MALIRPVKLFAGLLLCFVSILNTGECIRCSVCESSATEGTNCIRHPPQPIDCATGLKYCIAIGKYDSVGLLQTFTRSCSPIALPTACMPGIDRSTGEAVQVCYSMCHKDGCNGSKSLHHLLQLLRRRR